MHQSCTVASQHGQGSLCRAPEDAFNARHPKAIYHVLRQPEGHQLWGGQRQTLHTWTARGRSQKLTCLVFCPSYAHAARPEAVKPDCLRHACGTALTRSYR